MSERRLSSRAVKIGAVGAISAALATWGFVACSPGEDSRADCVTGPDANGEYTLVDEDECEDGVYSSNHHAFWYYNAHHRTGNRISGGTTLKPKSGGIKTSSGTTIRKGGFGSSGSSGGS
ncbi:hypothetical protein [Actinocorallia longicatena]|uniref:Lipoprotein n=1 Tax=Actinocorallia longicatena TaxID=111803 RepID=A0ABP6QKG7_9ACTN